VNKRIPPAQKSIIAAAAALLLTAACTPAPKEQKIVLDYLEANFPPRAPAGRGGWQNPFAPR